MYNQKNDLTYSCSNFDESFLQFLMSHVFFWKTLLCLKNFMKASCGGVSRDYEEAIE